jgi:hypothetical protein
MIEAEFGRWDLQKSFSTGEQCDPACRKGSSFAGVFSFYRAYSCSRKLSDFAGPAFKGTRIAVRTIEVHQMSRPKISRHKTQVHGMP